MPLRDHFRPPVEKRHSWDDLHGMWPAAIVQKLFAHVPEIRMSTIIEATFDGQVFRPTRPISLPPNTNVRLTVEPLLVRPSSFLRTAQSLNLAGPADWAGNLDTYLYGEGAGGAE